MAVVEYPELQNPSAEALALLRAGIDAVQAIGLPATAVAELEALTVGLLKESERLSATLSAAVSHCDRAGLAARRGSCGSTTAYLASFTHGPTSAIAPSKANGLWLIDFPELADAWFRGILTEAHIHELRKADNPRVHQLLIRDQPLHVDAANDLEFSSWLQHLAYWLLAADPDGPEPKDRHTRYGLTLRTNRTGDVTVTGTLDPLAGEALQKMIDHEAAKIRRRELDDNVEPIHQSTMKQRNVTALLRLCKRGFQREDGGWPAPLINIVMSEAVAEDLTSRMLDGDTHDPFELPLDFHDIDKRCETIRGTPIDPRRAWPALICGRLRRQVMKAKSRTKNLGYDVRLFNDAQRQALLVESRGQCTTSGCDAPFSWLEADHINPSSKGGATDLDDGQMKCRPDNLRKSDRTDLE